MLKYITDSKEIQAYMLKGFFVDWPNHPDEDTHLRLLESSYRIVLALDVPAERVAGFITAISDGVLSAYIPLLEVLPEYRNQGIGSELIRRMMVELEGIYMIDLMCDPELQPYYSKQRLHPATGMIHRNYAAQTGAVKNQ
ncbi:GNAT family N-acetyltransferase [Paenibacillus wulumuqiensis]|uniref:GNAT family N-acetyltransferase n=1 Tax=Paenibacillus wulumuqiensis TaxID=1567107 RepID=UPI000619B5A2|nr:GNAT family N-acetyltransferase [Paenibacillus wulumuqiensis]